MTFEDIKALASELHIGLTILIVILILFLVIKYIDKVLIIKSEIQKLFSRISKKARKGTISNSIRGKVLKASKSFRVLGQDLMISDLKINWVKEESPETFIKNNQVIIRMSQTANPYKNYVTAVNAFVGQALLPKAKKYIDPQIVDVSKLTASRLLIVNGDPNALEFFDKNILEPLFESDATAKEIFDQLVAIDRNGMFINILLNEYAKVTKMFYADDFPDPLLQAESRELLSFLYRIALGLKDPEDLKFKREYFKIQICLAASDDTYSRFGTKIYLKHLNESLSEGIETIYIFGLGRKIDIAKELAVSLKETDYRVSEAIGHKYRHRSNVDRRSVSGICYEINVYNETRDDRFRVDV